MIAYGDNRNPSRSGNTPEGPLPFRAQAPTLRTQRIRARAVTRPPKRQVAALQPPYSVAPMLMKRRPPEAFGLPTAETLPTIGTTKLVYGLGRRASRQSLTKLAAG